jgi:membrane-associated phospholipid phosphatase
MFLWEKITFLGDSVVLLPMAFIIAVWLVGNGSRRLAIFWCELLGVALFIVVASKIAFIGWGIGIQSLNFTGFSGHATRAIAVLPIVPFVLLQHARPQIRISATLAAIFLAILICVSRVAVGAHSVSEVIAGAALGGLVGIIFVRLARGNLPPIRHRWLIALSLLSMLGTSHAEPAPTHRWMVGMALYLSGHDRPYDRSYWNTRTCETEQAGNMRHHFMIAV